VGSAACDELNAFARCLASSKQPDIRVVVDLSVFLHQKLAMRTDFQSGIAT